jgi:hypothetical protein
MRVRDDRPEAFHDVHQADLRRDPIPVLRGIYERFELEWRTEVEQRMQRWLAERAERGPRPTRPDPADYGLSVAEIEREMADYADRYGL